MSLAAPAPSDALDALESLDDAAFRRRLREFLRRNYPEELRFPLKRLHWAAIKPWYLRLSRQGWLAPGWPREYGGMGLSAARQIAYMEEFERHGVARAPDQGVVMLGPLLIRYGTPAQKQFYLPRILSGEHIWCQGYSEPDSGSDLASLRTEAVLDGDHWVVRGQKTWTTLANDANWIFLLVRTERGARKQEGISFLLLPMDSPGVTVRPMLNLDLHDEFCEVFFDGVRVPRGNLVGQVNQGWSMAKALLGFERIFVGSPKQSGYAFRRLLALVEYLGVAGDPTCSDRVTRLRLDLDDHSLLYETFVERLRRGDSLGPDVSLLKINQTELYQRITEYMLELAGEHAGLLEPVDGNRDLNAAGLFLQSRIATIYGGSSEIQRNILAKHVLELPG
jgi:alkylation response protein AidB-like acyl-CoA dehydrogenase